LRGFCSTVSTDRQILFAKLIPLHAKIDFGRDRRRRSPASFGGLGNKSLSGGKTNIPARFAALDGLRGLAATLVVLYHVKWANHFTDNNFIANSYLAVDLFFILSGFIIFKTYQSKIANLEEALDFVTLRFFRVYPLHLAVLAFLVGVEFLKLSAQGLLASEVPPFANQNSLPALAANFTLLHGLHMLRSLSWNTPSWSISCEFATYLVFAAIALAGALQRRLFLSGLTLLCLAAYVFLACWKQGLDVTYDWGIIRCLAGFFLGAMLAVLDLSAHAPAGRLTAALLFGAIVAIGLTMTMATGPLAALAAPLFVLLIALLQFDRGPGAFILKTRPIQYLGRISYSIYMTQAVILVGAQIFLKRLPRHLAQANTDAAHRFTISLNPWLGDILVMGALAAIIAVSAFTYLWIEIPGRNFGRALNASRKRETRVRCGLTAIAANPAPDDGSK
jgi:peptidoglycan/LPS O-acetylase OafA/YrhL